MPPICEALLLSQLAPATRSHLLRHCPIHTIRFLTKGANLIPSQAIILIRPGFYAICNSVQMRECLSFIAGVKMLISIPLRSFNPSAGIHQPQIGVKLKRRLAGERPRQAGPSIAAAADVDEGF